ncbi:unnamed protein product [Rhodiola kirilowii]
MSNSSSSPLSSHHQKLFTQDPIFLTPVSSDLATIPNPYQPSPPSRRNAHNLPSPQSASYLPHHKGYKHEKRVSCPRKGTSPKKSTTKHTVLIGPTAVADTKYTDYASRAL